MSWSLKGKRINEPDCEQCSKGKIYSEETIRILHQKLIEDIENMRLNIVTMNIMHSGSEVQNIKRNLYLGVTKIINKRFGVE